MGTGLDVLMIGEEASLLRTAWERIVAETGRLHGMFNRFDPSSELSLINRRAATSPVSLSAEWWDVLRDVGQYHRRTLGYFDVTLRDYRKVRLDGKHRTVFFTDASVSLDFGGYAKGYALEKMRKILTASGIRQALVNFGNSSVWAMGAHPHGKTWNIGVVHPFEEGKSLKTYTLFNHSLSTSGNTATHTRHIIDPHQGTYSCGRKVVAAVCGNCVDAEVLTTALMAAGDASAGKITAAFRDVSASDIFNLQSNLEI
jgi:thiamine biosynthesis lipoprotein